MHSVHPPSQADPGLGACQAEPEYEIQYVSAPHEFEVYEHPAPSPADSIPEGTATGRGEDVTDVTDADVLGGEYSASMGGLGLGSMAGLGAGGGLGLGFGASPGLGMDVGGGAAPGLGSMTGLGAAVPAAAAAAEVVSRPLHLPSFLPQVPDPHRQIRVTDLRIPFA